MDSRTPFSLPLTPSPASEGPLPDPSPHQDTTPVDVASTASDVDDLHNDLQEHFSSLFLPYDSSDPSEDDNEEDDCSDGFINPCWRRKAMEIEPSKRISGEDVREELSDSEQLFALKSRIKRDRAVEGSQGREMLEGDSEDVSQRLGTGIPNIGWDLRSVATSEEETEGEYEEEQTDDPTVGLLRPSKYGVSPGSEGGLREKRRHQGGCLSRLQAGMQSACSYRRERLAAAAERVRRAVIVSLAPEVRVEAPNSSRKASTERRKLYVAYGDEVDNYLRLQLSIPARYITRNTKLPHAPQKPQPNLRLSHIVMPNYHIRGGLPRRNAFELSRLATLKRHGSDSSRESESESDAGPRGQTTFTREHSGASGCSLSPSCAPFTYPSPPTSSASDGSAGGRGDMQCEASPSCDSGDEDVFEDAPSSPLETPSSASADPRDNKEGDAPEVRLPLLSATDVSLPPYPSDAGRNSCQEPVPNPPLPVLSSISERMLEGETSTQDSSSTAHVPPPPSPVDAGRSVCHPEGPVPPPPQLASSTVSPIQKTGGASKRDSHYARIHQRPLPPRPLPDPLAYSEPSSTPTAGTLQQQSPTASHEGGEVLAKGQEASSVAHVPSPPPPPLPSCELIIGPYRIKATAQRPRNPGNLRITRLMQTRDEGVARTDEEGRGHQYLRPPPAPLPRSPPPYPRGRAEASQRDATSREMKPPSRGRSTSPKSLAGSETRRTLTIDSSGLRGKELVSPDRVAPAGSLEGRRRLRSKKAVDVPALTLKSQDDGTARKRAKRTPQHHISMIEDGVPDDTFDYPAYQSGSEANGTAAHLVAGSSDAQVARALTDESLTIRNGYKVSATHQEKR
ncbi:hypothetical protein C8T65DRAFT_700736 [Cerioporus squamosus]|nr:hypothetical protein C8T65DRAFT_700736 [Cerioporus squamosus]